MIFGSNKGMSKIPLFAIFRILGQIREFSLIWSSLIWSHDCRKFSKKFPYLFWKTKSELVDWLLLLGENELDMSPVWFDISDVIVSWLDVSSSGTLKCIWFWFCVSCAIVAFFSWIVRLICSISKRIDSRFGSIWSNFTFLNFGIISGVTFEKVPLACQAPVLAGRFDDAA